nr:DUF488 family protein [Staphylococcus coagulans]
MSTSYQHLKRGILVTVKIERIYTKAQEDNVVRVLVDRVWPRGISKADANLDYWLKEISPTSQLRKWFHHDPERFDTFKDQYLKELQTLDEQRVAFAELQKIVSQNEHVVLLYAAKDTEHNHAILLQNWINHPPQSLKNKNQS